MIVTTSSTISSSGSNPSVGWFLRSFSLFVKKKEKKKSNTKSNHNQSLDITISGSRGHLVLLSQTKAIR
jgi:hypothetical protein